MSSLYSISADGEDTRDIEKAFWKLEPNLKNDDKKLAASTLRYGDNFNFVVLNSYYGISREQIRMHLSPKHSIIAI